MKRAIRHQLGTKPLHFRSEQSLLYQSEQSLLYQSEQSLLYQSGLTLSPRSSRSFQELPGITEQFDKIR